MSLEICEGRISLNGIELSGVEEYEIRIITGRINGRGTNPPMPVRSPEEEV